MAPPVGYVATPFWMQPKRSPNDTDEFRASYAATELVNALYALDSGYTGKGVVVAIVDDGVVNANGELDGRISPLSRDFGSVTANGVTTKRDSLGDAHSDHGTSVANILGAAANGKGSVGYAPNVEIAVLRISDWNADTQTETLPHLYAALDYAGAQGIKIVNSSLTNFGNRAWHDALTRFATTGGLVVSAAGNTGSASPSDAAAIDDSNVNAVVFVGALAPNLNAYQLETYSSRAGTMMDRYVVAVGRHYTTNEAGSVELFSGTSSAAPVVAGLAADILSKWPQLTGQQAGDIILGTAKDIGEPGVDAVFGRGVVDFKAALAPVNPQLSNGTVRSSLAASVMVVPGAIGTGPIQASLDDVTLLDEYGRDFSGSIAGMVLQPQRTSDRRLLSRVRQLGGHVAVDHAGFSGGFTYARNPTAPEALGVQGLEPTSAEFGYRRGNTGVRFAWNASDSLQSDVMGLAPFADGVLAYAPQADNSIGIDHYLATGRLSVTLARGERQGSSTRAITLGWSDRRTELRVSMIDENGTVMGVDTGEGALRLGRGASTVLAEANRSFALHGDWQLEAYGSIGMTRLKIDADSLVTGATPLIGSRLGVQASRPAFGGEISFGLAQPLAIESGSALLTYGTRYDLDSRSLIYSTREASLAGARNFQLTGGFVRGGPRSSFRFGIAQDLNQGTVTALSAWALRWR